MENCMSLFGMVCLAREKCKKFLKQREICRGGVGFILLLFIFVGFLYQGLKSGFSFSFTARLGGSL